MIEREPNFEDEKIRVWAITPEDQKVEDFEGDPTMLSLDAEREEIFESRTYRFRPSPEALHYLMDLIVSQQCHGELSLAVEEVPRAAAELMEDVSFKCLAKRRKEDGLITCSLIATTPDSRSLLSWHECIEEAQYRLMVQEFESVFLPEGVLTQPLVVALEEWRRYSQGESFANR